MSFPNVIYGDYGDEKKTASSSSGGIGGLPLGTLMVLPDGRKFRHARATSGSTLSAGKLTTQPAVVADHGNVAGSGLVTAAQTVAIGDRSIIVTMGGTTAITKDQYKGGFMTVQSGTGAGLVYKVKSNNSTAVSTTTTIHLEDNDAIAATIAAGTTAVALRTNSYDGVTIRPATSAAVGALLGIPPVEVTASKYFWVQRGGECAGYTAATTIVVGDAVVASSSVAGAIFAAGVAATASLSLDNVPIGYAMNGVTATEYASIYLTLE